MRTLSAIVVFLLPAVAVVLLVAILLATCVQKKGQIMSSAKKADVSKLDNPAWSKANHQARTELCV